MRKLSHLIVALLLAGTGAANAQALKPLVIQGGQTKQLPAGATLQLNAGGTGGATVNIPQGVAPTSPNNGDCWITTAGFYCRVNGATMGPFTASGVPSSPSDATQFLNGATSPAFAAVKDSDLSTSDITTNNATSTKHGFSPKAPADATQFLNGATTPAYAAVKDSDLSTSDITTNNVSITKHGFAPKAPNDSTKYLDGTGAYSVPPGTGTGTVSTTGSPASGNLAKFSGATAITNGNLTGGCTTSGTLATTCIQDIAIILDGGGAALASGAKVWTQVDYNFTILAVTILADQSGSAPLSIDVCSYSSFDASTHPGSGDSIVASAPPSLSSATKYTDSTLTGWTTGFTGSNVISLRATGAATSITRVTMILKVQKTS